MLIITKKAESKFDALSYSCLTRRSVLSLGFKQIDASMNDFQNAILSKGEFEGQLGDREKG